MSGASKGAEGARLVRLPETMRGYVERLCRALSDNQDIADAANQKFPRKFAPQMTAERVAEIRQEMRRGKSR